MTDMMNTILDTREASRQLVRELDIVKEKVGLAGITYTQGHVLLYLENRGLLSVVELAGMLHLDRSTTSRAVSALVRKGYITQERSDSDKRLKLASLSQKGRELVERMHVVANEEVGGAMSHLTAEERRTVIEGMRLYARALGRRRMQQRYTIRPIEPSDDPYLARVIHAVMTEFQLNVPGSSLHDGEVKAMSSSYAGDKAAYFVVLDGEEVVGGAGIARLQDADESVCELKKMYLMPELRGMGMGARLLDLCIDAARRAGYKTCYLETIPEMSSARRLYEANGFQALGAPMGNTGHFRCQDWMSLSLSETEVRAAG